MSIDVRAVFFDAWMMWRRDRGILVALVGFFVFMPQLGWLLFGPQTPTAAAREAASKLSEAAQIEALAQLYAQYMPLLLVVTLATVFGALTVLMLCCDGRVRDVGGMLLAALRRLPAYFVLTLLVELVAALGIYKPLYLLLPALYVVGRLIVAGPIFAASGLGPFDAMAQSFRLTHRRGFLLAGFATLIISAGFLLPLPALALGEVLDRAPLANPVSALIIDAVAAGLMTVALLGGILIRVALYRRIGASNGI